MRMQNESGREVVGCALGQEALAERRLRWDALGARAGIDIVASDSGLRLIYRADNVSCRKRLISSRSSLVGRSGLRP